LRRAPSPPVQLEPSFNLARSEAKSTANPEPWKLAALEPIDDGARGEAEEVCDLASGEQAVGHAAVSSPDSQPVTSVDRAS
jgi:hypothetical protein